MLPLHAVPSWCTLSVSTSAVLDVFSLGDLLLASALGSGSGQEMVAQEPSPLCATWRRRCSPAGPAPQATHPDRMRRRVENKDPVLTGGFLAAGRSLMSVLGRGFNPI